MTELKRKQLYIMRLSSNLTPEIKTLFKGQRFKNAVRTSDDKCCGWPQLEGILADFYTRRLPDNLPFLWHAHERGRGGRMSYQN